MVTQALQFTENELVHIEENKTKRYPNLNTVMMVEDYLKEHADLPIKISRLKKQLPKQIMHQTLQLILEYLWKSGKIIYGPKGVQWIFVEPEHLKRMLDNTLEV